ncbi:MAG: NmrA family NAD(P)-binding protein [Chitinophaga sp.]|uniref:NmrA family NAD(P)-binding protein n=1 Tax=Chitinophaga sp. TaxID=1869181 RepID=UPI001B2BCEA6|nr:NmrA family NAD(P)-binding protein [Chitinophaga sp.]MBO9730721.1 NmrA family NAD(P)-binding protein [Chitinophaga sp.]
MILITTATGTTGYATTCELLKEGYPVRIYVRSANQKARALAQLGAEIAFGELGNYEALLEALTGVTKVYYNSPYLPGMIENVALFIKAALASGVESVVFMGQWLAEFDDQKSLHTNHVKIACQMFSESGLNVVYYNPGFFAENVIPLTESIVQLGMMPSPFGEGKCPWISGADQGRVIAALLKNPVPFYGQKIHPTGPRSIDATEMAAIYSKITGRKVKVMPITEKMFMKALISAGFDPFTAVQISFYMEEFRKGRFAEGGPTDVVKRLTGREPEDFETIAHQFVKYSPNNKRNFSGIWHTIKNTIKLMLTRIPNKLELAVLNQ